MISALYEPRDDDTDFKQIDSLLEQLYATIQIDMSTGLEILLLRVVILDFTKYFSNIKLPDNKYSFIHNLSVHFRFTNGTISKNNRNFCYIKALVMSEKIYLYLERITF